MLVSGSIRFGQAEFAIDPDSSPENGGIVLADELAKYTPEICEVLEREANAVAA